MPDAFRGAQIRGRVAHVVLRAATVPGGAADGVAHSAARVAAALEHAARTVWKSGSNQKTPIKTDLRK